MNITCKVLKALSNSIWLDTWPAEYICNNIIHELNSRARRTLNLVSLIIELAPVLRKLRAFSGLDAEAIREWIDGLDPGSLSHGGLEMLEFLLSAVYFVNEKHASRIRYDRRLSKISGEITLCSDITKLRSRYDTVVVGSGAGGSVVAWRLAMEGFKVAVFEAGPEPKNIAGEHPSRRAIKYYWDNGLTFTRGNPVISLPFGRVLGGTVTVNSGTMFRIPSEALNRWRDVADININVSKLDRAYEIVEEKLRVRTIPEELIGNNGEVMRRGAESLGLKHYPVRRPLGTCIASGECAFVCPNRGKMDMRLSFLREGFDHGLEIYCNTMVERVLIKGDKARGVEVNIGGSRKIVEADVVVVSAGALNTPTILRKSGVRNRNLGKHLHIHPAAGVTGFMDKEVYGWRGTMQSYCVEDLLREYHTLLLATFPPPGIGYSAGSIPLAEINRYPYMASIGVQTSDDYEGEVSRMRLIGVAKYNIDEHDLKKVIEGILLATEILFAAGAEKVYLPLKKNMEVSRVGEARNVLIGLDEKYFKLSAYHPMSTARMSGNEELGVVDESGRVYGYDNLYIADASILPSTTYVNPQLTINALSLLVAENIIRGI